MKEWLIEKGVSEEDIQQVMGLGAAKPLQSNRDEEGRARNRRVEIQFLQD